MGSYERPRAHADMVGGCGLPSQRWQGRRVQSLLKASAARAACILALRIALRQGLGQKITKVTYVLSITILGLQSNLVKQIQKHDPITCACVCACMCVPMSVLGWREKEGHVRNPEVLTWPPKSPPQQLPSEHSRAAALKGSSEIASHKGDALSLAKMR